ncbi:MAG TPA: non-ribosomal peptide synthetase module [Bacilli bacterium]|nr:non-ribosomal peptide synthetase module [Bacilli bacterium]
MRYNEDKVLLAFRLYRELARDGIVGSDHSTLYKADDDVRDLVDLFAKEVSCVIVPVGDQLFLIPETRLSPFHVNNEFLKKNYFRSGAVNADIYTMYFAILILFGYFYDSYQSKEATRDFIRMDDWVREVHKNIQALKEHDEEMLEREEKEFSYNWRQIIRKWDDMNDIRESAKRQAGNTISRLSFLDTVKRFLIDQELVREIGNMELALTEKAKTIIQKYFMDLSYNKGIFEFIYGEGNEDASD